MKEITIPEIVIDHSSESINEAVAAMTESEFLDEVKKIFLPDSIFEDAQEKPLSCIAEEAYNRAVALGPNVMAVVLMTLLHERIMELYMPEELNKPSNNLERILEFLAETTPPTLEEDEISPEEIFE